MESVLSLIAQLSRLCRGHLSEIALGLLATCLAVFGPRLNRWVRAQIGSMNTVIRTLLLVLFFAGVYGMGVVLLTPWLAKGLAQLTNYTLAPVLLATAIGLGALADRQRH